MKKQKAQVLFLVFVFQNKKMKKQKTSFEAEPGIIFNNVCWAVLVCCFVAGCLLGYIFIWFDLFVFVFEV